MTETAITTAVLTELQRAEAKYSWKNNNLIKQALVVLEEAGEVAQAVNNLDEKNGTIEQVRTELIQTAAMCFRMLKGLDEKITCDNCGFPNNVPQRKCWNCERKLESDGL